MRLGKSSLKPTILTKKVEEVQDSEKAAEVIQECKSIIRTKKKCIIRIAYHHCKVFKMFKDKEKFVSLYFS